MPARGLDPFTRCCGFRTRVALGVADAFALPGAHEFIEVRAREVCEREVPQAVAAGPARVGRAREASPWNFVLDGRMAPAVDTGVMAGAGATGMSAPALALAPKAGIGPVGWVRSPAFDSTLIGGVLVLALATAAALQVNLSLFAPLLLLNTWALAFEHVIATFTRLAFDTESFRRHRFLVLGLPLALAPAVLGIARWFGTDALMTVYFYWQWFHYTRQSYGIERLYWRKAGGGDAGATLNAGLLYATAVWGLANRSAQGMPFFGQRLFWIPVPPAAVQAMGIAVAVILGAWVLARIQEYRQGRLRIAHTLFIGSHVVLFFVAYIVLAGVTPGWLVVNVWHNAQYLLIVWLFNANRFKAGVDPQHRFLSTLCQPSYVALYAVTLVAFSALVYVPIHLWLRGLVILNLPAAFVVYQIINFHHYTSDAVIWKLRRQPIRTQFGLAT